MRTKITRRLITLSTGLNSNVDFSSDVGAGATMIELYVENTTNGNQLFGACHPDLTMMLGNIRNSSSSLKMAALDGSDTLDIQVGSASGVDVYIIAWHDGDITPLVTNGTATVVTPTNNTWDDIDHSALTTTAKFAIYDINRLGDTDVGSYASAIGDTTEPTVNPWPASLCGTDFVPMASLTSGYGAWLFRNGFYDIRITGFMEGGVTVVDPPVDKSTGTTGSWETITPTSGIPTNVIFSYRGTHTADATSATAQLAETNTGTNAIGKRPAGFNGAIMQADGSGNTFQNIGNTDYDFFVVGNFAEAGPTIDSVDDPDEFSGTLNYTTSGLGTITTATITDSAANVISLTSIGDTSSVIPDYGNNVNRVLTGIVTLELGDGVDTADTTFTLDPKTGYSSVKLTSGFSTTSESFLFNYGGTPAIGDEFHALTAEITLNADGSWETPGAGTVTIYGVDATDGVMQSFTHTTGAVVTESSAESMISPIASSIVSNIVTDI